MSALMWSNAHISILKAIQLIYEIHHCPFIAEKNSLNTRIINFSELRARAIGRLCISSGYVIIIMMALDFLAVMDVHCRVSIKQPLNIFDGVSYSSRCPSKHQLTVSLMQAALVLYGIPSLLRLAWVQVFWVASIQYCKSIHLATYHYDHLQ